MVLRISERNQCESTKEESMSKLKQMIAGSAVHSRMIDMKTYPVNDDSVIVEGRLRDQRYQTAFDLSGEQKPAGPIHQMDIRLLIQISSMEILDAEAELICVPHAQCEETLDSINRVIGLKIKAGFVKRVLQEMGGVKGCSHLTHLLTVMSQEVFQGIIVIQRKEMKIPPKELGEIDGLENLLDSCKMWGRDGIKLKILQQAIKQTTDD